METLTSSEERCREVARGSSKRPSQRSKEVPLAEPHSSRLLGDCQITQARGKDRTLEKQNNGNSKFLEFKIFQAVS